MNYRILLICCFLFSCVQSNTYKVTNKTNFNIPFSTQGFTLVYESNFAENKTTSKKLDNRSMIIFQKNLKQGTTVKIINLLNGKTTIAKVGRNSLYPNFYNSVITKRISSILDLNLNEPYIKILEINNDSTFIANEAKTFDEEKQVANKVPVEDIEIKVIGSDQDLSKNKKKTQKKFKYIIKVGDFYYKNTARLLQTRLKEEFSINDSKIDKLSKSKFRLFMGPYSNIDTLKKSFAKIDKLNFESIELIKQ